MKHSIIPTFVCILSMLGLDAQAQTEVNHLAEISSLATGTQVKVNLNDVHTSVSNYDYWTESTALYMQDETAGVVFKDMTGIAGGKTLNGSVFAITEEVNGVMALAVCDDTNTENISQTDWDYSGTPVTTIPDINEGKVQNMLVTLESVTSSATGSEYSLTLSDGTNEVVLYNDWDLVKLSQVPQNISSITALCVADVWEGGYYLIPIRQDLIKDADAPEDAKLVKTLADLSSVSDGDEVLVNLNAVYTTASKGNALFMEDNTAGTIFCNLDIAANKVLNGSIYATAVKVGNDICLKVNDEKTSLDNVTVTEGMKSASPVYLNGALSSYWHNRLIVLSDIKSEANGDSWTLTQGEAQMAMKDAFGQLADFVMPDYIKSLTGIVVYDEASEAYVIAPTNKDLIIEGEPPVEPTGIAAVKMMEGGTEFELQLNGVQVTSAEYYTDEEGNEKATYIIEDETGGLLMQQFPVDYLWQAGDRVTGVIYGTVNTDNTGYGMDVMAVGNEYSDSNLDFEIIHGKPTPTVVTCAEALTSRYYNCYVKLQNVSKTTGTMTFYGQEIEYNAVSDGTEKILFDDGWEVLPEAWQNTYGICQLPDDVINVAGHVEPYFGVTFIYPTSEDDVQTATGIKDLAPSTSEGNGTVYNLSGQRLSHPQKGINIINGRKVGLEQ